MRDLFRFFCRNINHYCSSVLTLFSSFHKWPSNVISLPFLPADHLKHVEICPASHTATSQLSAVSFDSKQSVGWASKRPVNQLTFPFRHFRPTYMYIGGERRKSSVFCRRSRPAMSRRQAGRQANLRTESLQSPRTLQQKEPVKSYMTGTLSETPFLQENSLGRISRQPFH